MPRPLCTITVTDSADHFGFRSELICGDLRYQSAGLTIEEAVTGLFAQVIQRTLMHAHAACVVEVTR